MAHRTFSVELLGDGGRSPPGLAIADYADEHGSCSFPEVTPTAYACCMNPGSETVKRRSPLAVRPKSPVVVIFDGDDTLWETEPLYDRARSEAAGIVSNAGLDAHRFEELQRTIDMDNVAQMGLSSARFPTSSVQAYEKLATAAGTAVIRSVSDHIYEVSAQVFERVAPVMPHARNVLEQMASSYRIALLTKGERAVQQKRIDLSKLAPYFALIRIVEEKNSSAFEAVLRDLNSRPGVAWSVGNSLPSDIIPAREIGMSAVWIDSHVWGHERSFDGQRIADAGVRVATDLSEVPTIVGLAELEGAE